MKKSIALLLLLVVSSVAFAQSPEYNSTREPVFLNTSDRVPAEPVTKSVTGEAAQMNIQSTAEAAHSFVINFKNTYVTAVPGSTVSAIGYLINLTSQPVDIKFYRRHILRPFDWTSSICFGINCYAATVDSFPSSASFTLNVGDTSLFDLNVYCPQGTFGDSLADYVRFVAVTGDPGDTLSALLTSSLHVSSVEQSSDLSSNLPAKIVSIYPSPLMNGNSVHVRISSPRDLSFTYTIFDGLGREVGFGTSRQHLAAGDNTYDIGELGGYTNGTYTLRFNFADGTMDTKMFQIIR